MIFIAPLVHIYFPKKNPDIEDYRADLQVSVIDLGNEITSIRSEYDQGLITANEYFNKYDNLIIDKEKAESENRSLLNDKVDSERVFGWKTIRIFLVGFGIRLPYLLFSIIISLLIARIRTRDINLSRTFFFLQTSCYSIATYELVWVFWDSQDYPIDTYRVAIIAMCVLVGFLCTYAFRYYESNVYKIIKLKGSFMNFIVEIRNKHYKPMLRKAMIQGLYDEVYQEEIKQETKEFDNRLRDKAEELIN